MSLKTLLHDLPVVDLIHCDIQFAESKAFAAGIKEATKRVRRVVIGTHSRNIKDELIETFRAWSWVLEYETDCKYRIDDWATLSKYGWRAGVAKQTNPEMIKSLGYLCRTPFLAHRVFIVCA